MDEKMYWIGFSVFPGVGPRKFTALLEKFKTAKDAWGSNHSELVDVLGEKLTIEFIAFKKTFNLENYVKDLEKKQIQYVTLLDKEYPALLRQISGRIPYLLFVKGDVSILNTPKSIGIVGTRKITPYGKEVTEMLTSSLVWNGFTIVSGLAFGVDGFAHTTTIGNRGKTIAVLGCGVDCCNPPSNQFIYDRILESGGTIVSTFSPGQGATIGSFPARNAIIAGLSLGVLVTEGAGDSGALITAEYAKKFGRPVFAVPGPITSSLSKGPNSLFGKGAVAVTNAEDILRVLDLYSSNEVRSSENSSLRQPADRTVKSNNQEEQEILDILESSSLHFDEIVRTIGEDSKTIGSLLSIMELKGMIKCDNSVYSVNF